MKEPGPANYYYGTLTYHGRSRSWVIKGEPCVCQLAKRLFPGSKGKRRGSVRFTAHKRIIGDLNWLMLRYPLEIRNPDKWKAEMDKAREYVLNRERSNRFPLKATPSKLYFQGELMEFQKEGLGFLLQHNRSLLADEMGLGKTVQALACLAQIRSWPVILVVPPHLVRNWEKEIERFLKPSDEAPQTHVIRGLKPYELPPAQIYIIHYLLLKAGKMYCAGQAFKPLFSMKFRSCAARVRKNTAVPAFWLTAVKTYLDYPVHRFTIKGGEIWNVMNILRLSLPGDWDSFSREWCYGYGNGIVIDPALLGDYLKREGSCSNQGNGIEGAAAQGAWCRDRLRCKCDTLMEHTLEKSDWNP